MLEIKYKVILSLKITEFIIPFKGITLHFQIRDKKIAFLGIILNYSYLCNKPFNKNP